MFKEIADCWTEQNRRHADLQGHKWQRRTRRNQAHIWELVRMVRCCWRSLAEALDSESHPLSVCGEPCEDRESFIPPGRNVIISITDEMLPQAAFYAFLFPLILWSDNSAASYTVSFFHSLSCSCLHSETVIAGSSVVIFWSRLEGAFPEFVTLFPDKSFSALVWWLILI